MSDAHDVLDTRDSNLHHVEMLAALTGGITAAAAILSVQRLADPQQRLKSVAAIQADLVRGNVPTGGTPLDVPMADDLVEQLSRQMLQWHDEFVPDADLEDSDPPIQRQDCVRLHRLLPVAKFFILAVRQAKVRVEEVSGFDWGRIGLVHATHPLENAESGKQLIWDAINADRAEQDLLVEIDNWSNGLDRFLA